MLEDALRTATLPDDGGRVLIIRKLDVGALRVGDSSTTVARSVERTVAALASRAVHGLHPSAANADVVYFRDVQESIAALATCIARQHSTAAWFWRLAVPAWRPEMSRDEALRALLFASCETPAPRVGAAELLRALEEKGASDALLTALRPSDGVRLLASSSWRAAHGADIDLRAEREFEVTTLDARVTGTLTRWVARWGIEDARTAWLACASLVANRPLRAISADLPRVARALVRVIAAHESPREPPATHSAATPGAANNRGGDEADDVGVDHRPGDAPAVQTPDRDYAQASFPRRLPELRAGDHLHEQRDTPDVVGAEIHAAQGEGALPARTVHQIPTSQLDHFTTTAHASTPPTPTRVSAPEITTSGRPATSLPAAVPWEEPDITTFGGLFLMLPVIARLGLPAQLESHPALIEADFPRRLLRYLALRLGADERDPVMRAIASGEEDDHVAWRKELVQWTVRVRRWCRTNTGLSVRTITCRPARLRATRTHIDVYFPLAHIDLRVRRAGLDIDPGWVPWFGRVVRFHYQRERGGHGNE